VLTASRRGELRSLAISPDGRILAVGIGNEDRGEVELWDIKDQLFIRRLTGYRGPVMAVSFSHDGTRLAAASRNACDMYWVEQDMLWTGYRGEARLWEVATGKLIRRVLAPFKLNKRVRSNMQGQRWSSYVPNGIRRSPFHPTIRSSRLSVPNTWAAQTILMNFSAGTC